MKSIIASPQLMFIPFPGSPGPPGGVTRRLLAIKVTGVPKQTGLGVNV